MKDDYLFVRVLPDGRAIYVLPLLFERARLGIGVHGASTMDDVW